VTKVETLSKKACKNFSTSHQNLRSQQLIERNRSLFHHHLLHRHFHASVTADLDAMAPWSDIRSLLKFSAVVRVILIIYGELQDSFMEVKYTDADYIVISDAASLVASGHSPYYRTDYRHSPFLAFLLLPNEFFHRSWGKFLFSSAGIACV
jgi:hypothetical protein